MTPPDSLCNRLTIPEFAPTEAVTSLFNRNTNLAASRFLNSRRLKLGNCNWAGGCICPPHDS